MRMRSDADLREKRLIQKQVITGLDPVIQR